MIVLLLFYPYRTIYDLVINDSYWDKYKIVISTNELSTKSLEVIQNIQGVSYNCLNFRRVKDELETTTIIAPHDTNKKRKCEENKSQLMYINWQKYLTKWMILV